MHSLQGRRASTRVHPLAFMEAHLYAAAGYLVSVDAYMNLQLANTEEFIEGQFTGNLGEVLIRYVPFSFARLVQ